ncbi:MAG: hypothetical protein PF503_26125 [Desulfobacula sp.]|jgi:hypothetical protein|nr:hypothetical protein [Desulfobacula sp.]
MAKFSTYLLNFFIFSLSAIQLCFSGESDGQIYEQTCTITKIEGPVITTSCKDFTAGEEMKIKDFTGRPILIYELPLPCLTEIEYTCFSEKNCASIISITLLQRIKVVPE